MRRVLAGSALTLGLIVLSASSALAQVPIPYSENFDGGSGLPTGWTEKHSSGAVPPVRWDVDATPAGAVGPGPDGPTFGGSAGSLNYNDGTDYDDLTANTGNAISPVIDVSGAGGTIIVSFECNWNTESGAFFDVRTMNVLDPVGGTTLASFVYDNAGGDSDPPFTTCLGPGTFHLHSHKVALGGATSVQIQFDQTMADSLFNTTEGWFVDNLLVTCPTPDLTAPSPVPSLLSPPDASIVSSPPGVLLDWSDSADTNPCGPGTPIYDVYLDIVSPPALLFASTTTSNFTTPVLAPGTYFWQIQTHDSSGNFAAPTVIFSFTVEASLAPLAPDTLFVNEDFDTAQFGDPGFVDPVTDKSPVFSAIYRDPNTTATATSMRWEISDDPTFTTVVFDSGPMGILPLPKDTRCPDLTINFSLQKDTVYFWRIAFDDGAALPPDPVSGLDGPFSSAQSFRIGDDFEFGVREGSSHHGRRCYVATAALGAHSAGVAQLASFRSSALEHGSSGALASRWYSTAGASLSSQVRGSVRPATATVVGLLGSAAGRPGFMIPACMLLLALLVGAAFRRG